MKTGGNVFLTGEPGAGKTHTINEYVSYLHEHNIEPAITASTGIAATHIGGMTIHSWSGIGIKSRLDAYELDRIATSEYVAKRIRKTSVLIIDEISMISPQALDMVEAVCRVVRQNEMPFGGLQVVFVGDFFQLPPIVKSGERTDDLFSDEEPAIFAYESRAWKSANPFVCYLSEQHRQDDKEFLEVLSAIRRDSVAPDHFRHIESRRHDPEKISEKVTKLFTHNADVDRVNDMALNKIPGAAKEYAMTDKGKEFLVSALKKGCLSPELLRLKPGAVVMFTKNNPKEGFYNGSLGIVENFADFYGYPIVRLSDGRRIEVVPMDWSVEENGKIKATISQLPLRLAWAITVHKSQGMSLEQAAMDLSGVFEYGQGYVALSRVRRLSGLYLLGISDEALRVHPRILAEDEEMKNKSEKAKIAFDKMTAGDLEKMHKSFVLSAGGTWGHRQDGARKKEKTTGKLAKLREKYPNAYRPWSDGDDKKLSAMFEEGSSMEKIATEFGRQTGSIHARLVKLGLVEDDYHKEE